MQKKYEILEHTADLKIKIFGKTRQDLFKNAMIGLFQTGKYKAQIGGLQKEIKIEIKSLDFPSLLVDFLSEILYLIETEKLVFRDVQFSRFSEKKIEATLIGYPLERMGINIKGVTYHDLKIRRKNNMWEATILFDI